VNINVVLHIIVTLSNSRSTTCIFLIYSYIVTLVVVEVEVKSTICYLQVLVVRCVGKEREPYVGHESSYISIICFLFMYVRSALPVRSRE